MNQVQDIAVIGNTIEGNGSSGVWGRSFSGSAALFSDNVIESNLGSGIFLANSSVTLTIQGNDVEGNGTSGVRITASDPGSSFAANIIDNTIKTSNGNGIYVTGGIVTVTVQGNDIEGNTADGIAIVETNASIGGTAVGAGNTITGNVGDGIDLGVSTTGGSATLQQNTIQDNQGAGVEMNSSNNTIGGTTAGAANIIATNTGAGVALDNDDPPTGNLISGNSIYGNGALGIDLDHGGTYSGIPLPNNSGIANNNGQNYPVVTAVAVTLAGATATGTLNSTPDRRSPSSSSRIPPPIPRDMARDRRISPRRPY